MQVLKITKKYMNVWQFLSVVCPIIFFILNIVFPSAKLSALIYMFIVVGIIGDYVFLNNWHDEGITWFRKADKNFSKRLTRKPDDACLFVTVFKTICVCLVYIFVDLDTLYANTIFAIILWIINIIGIILLIGITHISYNKVMKIIPKKK